MSPMVQIRALWPLGGNRIALIICFLTACSANATSIMQRSLNEMILGSELIFEGKVVHIEANNGHGRQIHTRITFEILDIIKGGWDRRSITLNFQGGRINGNALEIDGMRYPQLAEKGIYFVESLERRQVHPLFGWSQGHFVTFRDAFDVERVMTANKKPVMALDFASKRRKARLSQGIADGIVLENKNKANRAIPTNEFKQVLIGRLKGLEP